MNQKQIELTNRLLNAGKDAAPVNYTAAFVLNSIYCKGCNNFIAMKSGVVICLTIDEIVARGEREHSLNSICNKPQLALNFGNVLLSDTLYKDLTK